MQVLVQTETGRMLHLDAHPQDTFYVLQNRLAQETGLPIHDQSIVIVDAQGQECPFSFSHSTPLDSYGFPSSSCYLRLQRRRSEDGLYINLEISLFKKKQTLSVEVPSDATVGDIKSRVFAVTRIPQGQQILAFNGVELRDDSARVKQKCGMYDGAQLELKGCACRNCPYRDRFY